MSVKVTLEITNAGKASGLAALNAYLMDKSFVIGFKVSAADSDVFKAIGAAPSAEKYPNVARWYSFVATASDATGNEGAVTFKEAEEVAVEEESDDEDLFASDDEDADAAMAELKAKKEAEKAEKKKNAPVGKSSVLLDVKPWGAETDMKLLEEKVRSISMEGLKWNGSELRDVAYGVKKLCILCTIVDDLVPSTEDLIEPIEAFEDLVQSVDIAAFNKV